MKPLIAHIFFLGLCERSLAIIFNQTKYQTFPTVTKECHMRSSTRIRDSSYLIWMSLMLLAKSSPSQVLAVRESRDLETDLKSTQTQRSMLELLYNECHGNNWRENNRWLDIDTDICSWYGVYCSNNEIIDENGEKWIVALKLPKNNLNCTIPEKVFQMPHLEILDLGKNAEVDVSFNQNTSSDIRSLILNDIAIKDLSGIGSSMTKLQSLVLRGNDLTGTFPAEINDLTSLRYLDLSNNLLTGTLPDSVGNLVEMKGINLAHNVFTGQITPKMGNLIHLDSADLSYNAFTGTLPPDFENLTELTALSLNDQARPGITGPLISFESLPSLHILNLARNSLTGTVPQTLLQSTDENSFMTVIDLSSNHLKGVIPATLDRFKMLRIYAMDNEIEGIDPQLCAQRSWFFNEVNFFGCDAILCPPSTASMFGRQTSAGAPCEVCPNGFVDAPFYGSTSCSPPKLNSKFDLKVDQTLILSSSSSIGQNSNTDTVVSNATISSSSSSSIPSSSSLLLSPSSLSPSSLSPSPSAKSFLRAPKIPSTSPSPSLSSSPVFSSSSSSPTISKTSVMPSMAPSNLSQESDSSSHSLSAAPNASIITFAPSQNPTNIEESSPNTSTMTTLSTQNLLPKKSSDHSFTITSENPLSEELSFQKKTATADEGISKSSPSPSPPSLLSSSSTSSLSAITPNSKTDHQIANKGDNENDMESSSTSNVKRRGIVWIVFLTTVLGFSITWL